MKKIIFVLVVIITSLSANAQGNSGNKGKGKDKDKSKTENIPENNPGNSKGNGKPKEDKAKNDEYDRKVWDGVADAGSGCMKPSKNQPAKVTAAFQRDYPGAMFVRWTKCRGDWTASFNNGIYRSTAVYHANGDRRDTRTFVQKASVPVRILDIILKRFPGTNVDGAIKIQVPNIVNDIFRIKNMVEGRAQYLYMNTEGVEVQYNY